MKKLFSFVLTFSLLMISAAVAESEAVPAAYVPERENIYGLYWDTGAHSSQITVSTENGKELDFETFYSDGRLQTVEVALEQNDGE